MGLTDSLEFANIFFFNRIADNQAETFDKA